MAFSYQTKVVIHNNAGGQCECIGQSCGHIGRCIKICTPALNPLSQLLQATKHYIFPGFEFHHRQSQAANGADTAANGAFLCTFCHQQTRSYGTNLTLGR